MYIINCPALACEVAAWSSNKNYSFFQNSFLVSGTADAYLLFLMLVKLYPTFCLKLTWGSIPGTILSPLSPAVKTLVQKNRELSGAKVAELSILIHQRHQQYILLLQVLTFVEKHSWNRFNISWLVITNIHHHLIFHKLHLAVHHIKSWRLRQKKTSEYYIVICSFKSFAIANGGTVDVFEKSIEEFTGVVLPSHRRLDNQLH
jgi:hypothetical protein